MVAQSPEPEAHVLNARAFQIELRFRSVGFCGEGKTGVPGEKPVEVEKRTNNKLNPHMTSSPGIEPGPHWWKASALTAAPSLLPRSDISSSLSAVEFQHMKYLAKGKFNDLNLAEMTVPCQLLAELDRVSEHPRTDIRELLESIQRLLQKYGVSLHEGVESILS